MNIKIALTADAARFVDDYRARTGDQRPAATGIRTGWGFHVHPVPGAQPEPASISGNQCLKPAYVVMVQSDWSGPRYRIMDDHFVNRDVAPTSPDWLDRPEWVDMMGRPFTPFTLLTVCPASSDPNASTAGGASLASDAATSIAASIVMQQISATMQDAAQPATRPAQRVATPIPAMTQPALALA